MKKKYIMGNWKMNMLPDEAAKYMEGINRLTTMLKGKEDVRKIVLFVPSVDYYIANLMKEEQIYVGLQNMYFKDKGAYTGEISYEMVKALNAEHVLVGHSERREIFKEDDSIINEKVKAGLNNGIKVVLCVGESEETYNEGKTKEFVENQIIKALEGISKENISNEEDLIIAYEPIWAIGTGKVCSSDDADNMCKVIRDKVKEILDIDVPVLYGGSVNEQNSNEILLKENIDGVLVGGASLDPEKFAKIIYSGHKLGE